MSTRLYTIMRISARDRDGRVSLTINTGDHDIGVFNGLRPQQARRMAMMAYHDEVIDHSNYTVEA